MRYELLLEKSQEMTDNNTNYQIMSDIKTAVDEINAKATIEEQVIAFMSYPKAMRREIYGQLTNEVKKKARSASEERRGIAFRTQDGDIVFSREAFIVEATRLKAKHDEMEERKAILGEKLVALSAKASKFYGEEFAKEVEAITK